MAIVATIPRYSGVFLSTYCGCPSGAEGSAPHRSVQALLLAGLLRLSATAHSCLGHDVTCGQWGVSSTRMRAVLRASRGALLSKQLAAKAERERLHGYMGMDVGMDMDMGMGMDMGRQVRSTLALARARSRPRAPCVRWRHRHRCRISTRPTGNRRRRGRLRRTGGGRGLMLPMHPAARPYA